MLLEGSKSDVFVTQESESGVF